MFCPRLNCRQLYRLLVLLLEIGSLSVAQAVKVGDIISASSHGRVSGGLDMMARCITVSMGGFEVSGSAQVAGVLATVGAVNFGDSLAVVGAIEIHSSVLACLEVLVGSVSVVGSANLGSICLSIRNWARLGSGVPVDLRVNLGEAASRRSLI